MEDPFKSLVKLDKKKVKYMASMVFFIKWKKSVNQTFFRLLPTLRGEKTKPSALGMSDPVCGLGWLGWSSRSILVHQRLTWISWPSNLSSNQAAVGVAGRAAELHGCVRGSAARDRGWAWPWFWFGARAAKSTEGGPGATLLHTWSRNAAPPLLLLPHWCFPQVVVAHLAGSA